MPRKVDRGMSCLERDGEARRYHISVQRLPSDHDSKHIEVSGERRNETPSNRTRCRLVSLGHPSHLKVPRALR